MSLLLLESPGREEAELKELIDVAFDGIGDWSTGLPSWKRRLLEAWGGRSGDLELFFREAPVAFTFKDPGARHGRLFIAGNWDESGEPADLGGWRYFPMQGGEGRWTFRRRLRLTRARHLYHAVVRTAPWPMGRAVGAVDFAVRGETSVEISAKRGAGPAAAPAKPRALPGTRLSVLGLDGGSWHVLLPLIHQGRLPAFARLLREGYAAGTVSSGEGLPSLPNIYGAMTGKLPHKHGIGKDYFGFNLGRRSAPLWLAASAAGVPSSVVSMWATLPPDAVRGAMVTEAFFAFQANKDPGVRRLAAGQEVAQFAARFGVSAGQIERLLRFVGRIDGVVASTHPPGLAEELKAAVPFPALAPGADLTEFSGLMDEQIIRTVSYLLERRPTPLLCAYLSDVDHASHQYWSGFEPSLSPATKPLRDARVRKQMELRADRAAGGLLKAYERADRLLAGLLERSESILVFSDHGSGPTAEDFISLKFSFSRLADAFARAGGTPAPPGLEAASDRERWTASMPEGGAAFAEGLAAFLKAAAYLPTGQPAFSGVEVGREGGSVALRFVLEQPRPMRINGLAVGGKRHGVLDFFELEAPQGAHKADGMVLLWGPNIARGFAPEPIPVLDVAPTALRLLGLPLGRDMDGRPLNEAFEAGWAARNPERFVATHGSGGSGLLRLLGAIEWRKALSDRGAPPVIE